MNEPIYVVLREGVADGSKAQETILVTCAECHGAGEWDEGPINTSSHGGPADPQYRQVICPECDGTGEVFVEAEPITLEDLDEAGGA